VLPRLVSQPLGGCVIDFRPGAVVSLGIIRLQHIRHAFL
jgi:hypothetical protein